VIQIGPEVLFETCVGIKFVDDDDDDESVMSDIIVLSLRCVSDDSTVRCCSD